MKNVLLAKALSGVVVLAGLMVMAGWCFNIEILKSILPGWISMKFTTALCFFLSGLILYAMAHTKAHPFSDAVLILPIASLIMLLFMATFLAGIAMRISLGVEELFFKDISMDMTMHWQPGVPSVAVMICFVLVAVDGILVMLKFPHLSRGLCWSGRLITLLGSAAVLGYMFQVPVLRYDISGWSNPMALHTALLSVMMGAGIMALGTASVPPGGESSC